MQGISGAPKGIVPRQTEVQQTELTGPGGAGGMLNVQKDAKEASTEAKFSDVWKNIQSRYGAKPEKPREIKKALGKDDFLRIMMTQMKNQDPTNPFKAEQFATQMAQFTSVEQLQNLNLAVNKMSAQNQPLERMAMTNMIGKTVTIDRERFLHTENQASTLQYDLSRDAQNVTITMRNADNGETIAVKELGPMKQGAQTFAWDGGTDRGGPAKTGNYLFKVDAKDQAGRVIAMETKGQAPVVGVSFEGSEAVLLVGDGRAPQKVTLRNVIRVDSNGNEGLIPGAQSLARASAGSAMAMGEGGSESAPAAAQAPASPTSNFFTFEKGKGSMPIDAGNASPEALQALQRYEAARAAAGKISSTEEVENNSEGGFPNGISSGDNG